MVHHSCQLYYGITHSKVASQIQHTSRLISGGKKREKVVEKLNERVHFWHFRLLLSRAFSQSLTQLVDVGCRLLINNFMRQLNSSFFLLSPPQSFHSSSFLLIHNSWLFTSRSSFSANFQKDRKAFKASTKERKKNCGKLNLYNRCEYPKISSLSFSLCPTTIENTKLNGWEKRLAVTVVVV